MISDDVVLTSSLACGCDEIFRQFKKWGEGREGRKEEGVIGAVEVDPNGDEIRRRMYEVSVRTRVT